MVLRVLAIRTEFLLVIQTSGITRRELRIGKARENIRSTR